jgi:MFS family permease
MDFLSVLGYLVALLIPSAATVYIARMYGRSGWRWLLISLVLPFLSVFLIMLLVSRESLRREHEEDERQRAERGQR